MAGRIRSYLHIFSPQQHHFPLIDPGARQLPMALEIPEYICPLHICDNNPTLQSLHQSEPCISLASEAGGTYLFDGIITDQTVYRAMNSVYLYEQVVPPNPLEKLDAIACDIAAGANAGVSQLVVSAGPVGSGHGTIAFSCLQSSVAADRGSASRIFADQRCGTCSTCEYQGSYQSADLNQLITSCVDDALKQVGSSQHHRLQTMTPAKEPIRRESSPTPQGLLWRILKHLTFASDKNDTEWPKLACFTLDSGQQVMDLLDYPGITEAYGMGDHLDMQSIDYVDCPDKSVEYQMYTEKFGDRAQTFEGTAYGNVHDAASAFLASGIVQPGAKDLTLPFRKAMSMSQHFNPLKSSVISNSNTFTTGGTVLEKRTNASGTLHIQSLYPDDPQDQSGSKTTRSHVSELSVEARTYLGATSQSAIRKMRLISTISTKTLIKALSKPSLVTLKTHNGLITPECMGKSGLRILNLNPSSLSLLKRSLSDRRRPICTWDELTSVSDGTAQRRGSELELPCLLNIRKQTGLPNYVLAMDSCGPTVVVIYLGPSQAYSCIIFVDICTCTTQTPLQQFSLKPQFKTSLESLAALKSLVDNLSTEKRASQPAKAYMLTRLILGHVPNLSLSSKEAKRSVQHVPTTHRFTYLQDICKSTQKASGQCMYREADTALESISISDSNLNVAEEHDTLSDVLDNDHIHESALQQISDSVSTDLPAINYAPRDITFIHSVQICETDAKNTLQQLRLASSLDKKVEMGFYWSTQLYNDAMCLARIDLLQKEGDDNLSSMPVSHISDQYDSQSVADCKENPYASHGSPVSRSCTVVNLVRPDQGDTFDSNLVSAYDKLQTNKEDNCGELTVMNSGLPTRKEESQYKSFSSPSKTEETKDSLPNKHLPILQSPSAPDSSQSQVVTTLLLRLHKYIDRAQAMRDEIDAKITAGLI